MGELVPHSIVDSDLRWHVRPFDRRSQSYRDVVLIRISKVTIQQQTTEPHKDKLEDHQWMRMMPNTSSNNVNNSTAIELDFGIES